MENITRKSDSSQPAAEAAGYLFDDWFDPVEAGVRDRLRGFIQAMVEGELDAALMRRSGFFVNHVASLAAGARERIEPASALGREAFEIAQWANQSAAAAAVQQLTPRFASGNDALAALVRQDQDLSAYRRDPGKALGEKQGQPGGGNQTGATRTDPPRK